MSLRFTWKTFNDSVELRILFGFDVGVDDTVHGAFFVGSVALFIILKFTDAWHLEIILRYKTQKKEIIS